MGARELLEEAMRLKSSERAALIEGLIMSLDRPDETIEKIWVEEAQKRLEAYRSGKLAGIPMEEVFKEMK